MNLADDDTLASEGSPEPPAELGLADGSVFAGRYRIEASVGRGAMGSVYRVFDRQLEEIVALKVLIHLTDVARALFLNEVRLARRVTHPNVARTHDVGEAGPNYFLTMELIEGTSLDKVLVAQGPLAPDELVRVGAAIADGLSAAHAAGIVHRDLKPANVMLGNDGRVVITDFGIARSASQTSPLDTQSLAGTPNYMAPEQVSGAPVDARADVYALGVMLFELGTGRLPFEGSSAISVAMARLHQDPPDPRTYGPMSDELARVVLGCMARAPEARFGSAAAVRTALLSGRSATRGTNESLPAISSTPFAPFSSSETSVAVLPFRYRGPSDHDYLGDGLAESLIDVLSHTQGLRVLSLGSTARFGAQRDPVELGRTLGVSTVVDGSAQVIGTRLRLTARLVSPQDGEQQWSDRFDGELEDVFALQESVGRRVAEALRVELSASLQVRTISPEAMKLYLRARKFLRADVMTDASQAIEMLDRSLALVPDYPAALSAHAMASVRAWWGHASDDSDAGEQAARQSVTRAIEGAVGLAETHLARAMLAVQVGSLQEGARALRRALELAPTMADAHQYLGELQVEGGLTDEGVKRLELAVELDRSLSIAHISLARVARLRGEIETFEHHNTELERIFDAPTLPILNSRFRWAMYVDNDEIQDQILVQIEAMKTGPATRMARLFSVARGRGTADDVLTILENARGWAANVRFTSYMEQVSAEVLAAIRADEVCLQTIERSARAGLLDLLWLERCPLFARLRELPRFREARRLVKQRAAEMWRR